MASIALKRPERNRDKTNAAVDHLRAEWRLWAVCAVVPICDSRWRDAALRLLNADAGDGWTIPYDRRRMRNWCVPIWGPVIDPRRDIPAGLAVAGLLVPEAVAYAAIAGLQPIHALIAAVTGLVVYAGFGRSRFAIVAPTSSSAAVLAAGLALIGAGDAATRVVMAGMVVAFVGIFFLLAGAFRLGSLASFVSRPVLMGFAFGLAVSIVIRQVPTLVGLPVEGSSPPLVLVSLLAGIARWSVPSLAIGGAALATLLVLRRLPSVPAAFSVLCAGIALSYAINLPAAHVAVIGPIDLTLAWPQWPDVALDKWLGIANVALPLALILFVESWGTMRTLALRHGDAITSNRELVVLGATNLVSGALGGMPAGAGFSASSANEAAGCQSRASGLVAALAVVVLVLAAGPLIARTPEPVLAAIVIAALAHALDPQALLRLWRIDRDQIVAIVAALGVIVLGVLNGMLFAVALSVLALIRRIATPQVAVLGQLGTSQNYVDLSRHPEARTNPGVLIVRPGEPMFFANADSIMAEIETRAAAGDVRIVVLSLEESADLDSTALDVLAESSIRLAAARRQLVVARMKDTVHDLMIRAGEPLATLAASGTRSVADAMAALSPPNTEPPR
jgi:MFS superfamily sulfate permease-like transporter